MKEGPVSGKSAAESVARFRFECAHLAGFHSARIHFLHHRLGKGMFAPAFE